MKLSNINWNSESYKEFLNYLYSLEDLKYKKFHSSLTNNSLNMIGIRVPILKNIAKEISMGDYDSFIKCNSHNTYEETLIHGLIIGYIKINFDRQLNYIDNYINLIDNWATNDVVCANLKSFKKNKNLGYNKILKYLNSNNYWHVRFGIVLLLDYFICDEYIDLIIKLIANIDTNEYYVMMSLAWLISICYIKYPDKSINIFKNNLIDTKTNNQAIRKILDSYRVSENSKNTIKEYYKKDK